MDGSTIVIFHISTSDNMKYIMYIYMYVWEEWIYLFWILFVWQNDLWDERKISAFKFA